jgi:high-affinity K+ transport system ATPase subunit B
VVCAAVSPALVTLLLAGGAADGVVGVTLTTCEGDCVGAEFVDVVPAAVCCDGDDTVDGGDDATGELLGVDAEAGPVVVTVVVAPVADGLVLEVASGGADSVVDDAPDMVAEADGETLPDELGVSVALGSRVATLAFSWLT